jgi:hypothetical protein
MRAEIGLTVKKAIGQAIDLLRAVNMDNVFINYEPWAFLDPEAKGDYFNFALYLNARIIFEYYGMNLGADEFKNEERDKRITTLKQIIAELEAVKVEDIEIEFEGDEIFSSGPGMLFRGWIRFCIPSDLWKIEKE